MPGACTTWTDSLSQRLLRHIQTHALRRGDFVLASGKRSEYYLDCRLSTLSSEGAFCIGQLLTPKLLSLGVDAVGGMTMGADPIVGAVLTQTGHFGQSMDGFLVRKAAKGHGTGKQVEGHLEPWMRVALVEDVVTSGGSTLKAIAAVKKACPSVTIVGVFTLVDRNEGGAEAIRQAGYHFEALFQKTDILG